MRKTLLIIQLLFLWLLVAPPPHVGGEEPTLEEHCVKAAFIFKFIKYVDWPDPARGGSAVTIGVIGDSPVAGALDDLAGKQVKVRQVTIRHIRQLEELKGCDIIFISQSEKGRMGRILGVAGTRPILTISDNKRFLSAGGMIYLYGANQMVHFRINQQQAQRVGLRISAMLLQLAIGDPD